MSKAGRFCSLLVASALALAALVVLGACSPQQSPPTLKPKIAPPVIGEAGVLRAGVDLSYPPFGGTANGRQAGLDIDVASALAGRLGLEARIVDVKSSEIASALADGRIDIGLSAPFSSELLSRATIAGTYVTDAPALFSTDASLSVTPTSAASVLDGVKLGAQQDSDAYWRLVQEHGSSVASFGTLREALAALSAGDLTAVGGDALVGGYIARDYPGVRFAGTLADARPLGVAVSSENARLGEAVRTTLDAMAADGVLEAIRTAWVGNLPKLPIASVDATPAPVSEPGTP